MFSIQEASKKREEFWTRFGQYMLPVLSAAGEKINWVNYKTGNRHVRFRMDAGTREALIIIEIDHKSEHTRQLYFQQFLALKKQLDLLPGTWIWEAAHQDENGKTTARIYSRIEPVNIFLKEDWPRLISFFKQGMVALDAFWNEASYSFEALN